MEQVKKADELPGERSPATHELKTWPEYFYEIKAGHKRFEFRKNDRDFKAGDILILREWEPGSETYTGEQVTVNVSYVLNGGELPGIDSDMCIISISLVDKPSGNNNQFDEAYWTKLHHQAAIAAMQGLMPLTGQKEATCEQFYWDEGSISEQATRQATALIQKLKQK